MTTLGGMCFRTSLFSHASIYKKLDVRKHVLRGRGYLFLRANFFTAA
jgi:hypothetical protein